MIAPITDALNLNGRKLFQFSALLPPTPTEGCHCQKFKAKKSRFPRSKYHTSIGIQEYWQESLFFRYNIPSPSRYCFGGGFLAHPQKETSDLHGSLPM